MTIPYGRHQVDEADIQAVIDVLRSDWLTTGPTIARLESALSQFVAAKHVLCVNSGTAALHCAMHAIGVGPGDQVIVPAMTFAATANAVLYQCGTPVFADVLPHSLLLDPADVARKITPQTRAIVAVDYAGAPCDYAALRDLAEKHRLTLIADACHSLGGSSRGAPVGSLADLSCFSMHPVKPITSGEGGFVATDNELFAERIRTFRNHGIDLDFRQRELAGSWKYSMCELGFNYRLNDIQAALALSQLSKLKDWTLRRQQRAAIYDQRLSNGRMAIPLTHGAPAEHAFHLYVVRWQTQRCGVDRDTALNWLRRQGIGVNVHYWPVYLHPYYQRRFQIPLGTCPVAERAATEIMSLPLFPGLSDEQQDEVIQKLDQCGRTAKVA